MRSAPVASRRSATSLCVSISKVMKQEFKMADTTKVLASNRVTVTPGNGKVDGLQGLSVPPDAPQIVEGAPVAQRPISLRDVRNNDKVRAYIEKANEQMATIGYSEHGLRHAALVAAIARNICLELGFEPRTAELAAIAGYLHDIGNCVHRFYHPQIGATMAFQLLDAMDMEAEEIAT